MVQGIHRIRNGWATEHSVIVDYGGIMQVEIPESRYRAVTYSPNFDELPWSNQSGSPPKGELEELRRFRDALTSGSLKLQNGDPTLLKRELEILKREIAYLEGLISHSCF